MQNKGEAENDFSSSQLFSMEFLIEKTSSQLYKFFKKLQTAGLADES